MLPDIIARYVHVADLLAEHGLWQVGMPHVRPLAGKRWEMRLKGCDGIARAIYVARVGQRLTVLHVVTKKTQRCARKWPAPA